MRLTLALATLFVLAGCKAATWKKTKPDESAKSAVNTVALMPKKVGEGDATKEGAVITFDVDEKTGRARSTLVLRLDYFPEPRPGVTNLPACYAALPGTFELGVLSCVDKPGDKKVVFVRNVDQDCYTNPKDDRVAASEPVTLPGCRRGQLLVHAFEPGLKVDTETRDVN